MDQRLFSELASPLGNVPKNRAVAMTIASSRWKVQSVSMLRTVQGLPPNTVH